MRPNADPFDPVETARLKLRCVRPGDAARTSAMMTRAVSRWVASWSVPFTPKMATERIAAARVAAEDGRALPFVAERRSDGALRGWVGVTRDAMDNGRGVLGYWLGEEFRGCGYMREAAQAVVVTAFERLNLNVIEAGAQPENAASFAVMRRCGMTPAGERMVFAPARERDELCLLYEKVRPAT